MDNQQERLFELGWLVAMIEGEGNISLTWSKKKSNKFIQLAPRVQITNSDEMVIKKAQKILSDYGIGNYVSYRNGIYHLMICGMKRCNKILVVIKDYMLGKHERAKLLYEYTSYRLQTKNRPYTEIDKQYFLKMRSLNNKPITPTDKLLLMFEVESSTTIR